MFRDKIEIIEPYEDETFFSWVIRLGKWYGYTTVNQKEFHKFMVSLFGTNSKRKPALYIPENLNFFVENINLPESSYFSSVVKVVENMTVYAFYKYFIDKNKCKKLIELFKEHNEVINSERKLGVRTNSQYYEKIARVKFCKKCMKENVQVFFNREHQVQENFICYKHMERLQYIQYDFKNTDFLKITDDEYENAPYCIQDDDIYIEQYENIARMIHFIFVKGLSDDIIVIKSKLRKRLKDMGWMDSKNYFYDINKFLVDFNTYCAFHLDEKTLFCLLFNTKGNFSYNPIWYLSLISYLFGTLETFEDYKIHDSEVLEESYNPLSYKLMTNKPHCKEDTLLFYSQKFSLKYDQEYLVIGISEDKKLTIRHNKCGHLWTTHITQVYKFAGCPKCRNKRGYKLSEKKIYIEKNYPEFEILDGYSSTVILRHRTCNNMLNVKFRSLLNGYVCPKCKGITKYRERMNELLGDEYKLINYQGTDQGIFIHNIEDCNKIFIKNKQFFWIMQKCPICRKLKPCIK